MGSLSQLDKIIKIGFDAKRAFNNTSGLGNYSRNTIRLLADRFPDNQYLLYTPGVNGSLDFKLPPGSRIETPVSWLGKHCSSIWRSLALSRRLKHDGIDLYHGLSHDLPVGLNKSGVKKVVTIHDMIAFKHPEMFSPVNRHIYKRKIAHSCSTADMIIAISRQTKEDIEEFLDVDSARVKVVYQTCDHVFYHKADEDFKETVKAKYGLPSGFVLSVGTIEPRKNLPAVIRAMQLGAVKRTLVVVGKKTGYLNTVKDTAHSAGIKNILFLENVPVEELAAIYQLAGVFVYPSLYEGFGIPILEALSSGTPVITSLGSCFGETGGPHSLYVDPADNKGLADAINSVLSDDVLRKKMIGEGIKHAEKFRHNIIAEKLMAVYNSTINNKLYE
ncbi:MAG: glycosyltransferase family 4 protein [Bacteroidales bacterium]